jgi:hypothetical protein
MNFAIQNFGEILQDFENFSAKLKDSERYFVPPLTVYREYIPAGFKVLVKSEVAVFT